MVKLYSLFVCTGGFVEYIYNITVTIFFTGEMVELYGLARVTLTPELKILKLDIHYKPGKALVILLDLDAKHLYCLLLKDADMHLYNRPFP